MHAHRRTHAHTHTHTLSLTRTHTHAHARTHTHTHTHTHGRLPFRFVSRVHSGAQTTGRPAHAHTCTIAGGGGRGRVAVLRIQPDDRWHFARRRERCLLVRARKTELPTRKLPRPKLPRPKLPTRKLPQPELPRPELSASHRMRNIPWVRWRAPLWRCCHCTRRSLRESLARVCRPHSGQRRRSSWPYVRACLALCPQPSIRRHRCHRSSWIRSGGGRRV